MHTYFCTCISGSTNEPGTSHGAHHVFFALVRVEAEIELQKLYYIKLLMTNISQ